MTPPPPALLLLSRGDPDDEGAQALESFVRDLAKRNPETPVACGFTQPRTPSPGGFSAELADGRVTRFAAVPLALVSSETARDDALTAAGRVASRHPGVSYACGRPLGPHPALLPVLERRVEEALDGLEGGARAGGSGTETARRSPGDRAGTTVLLVAEGASDPESNAEVHKAARLLWEGRGYAGVEAAFVSRAAPDVASGLDRCRKLGARKVVVLPYFLFASAHAERARMHAEGWSLANPDVEVVHAGVMGATEELAGLVLERYREAAAEALQTAGARTGPPGPWEGPGDGHGHPHGDEHPDGHGHLPHGGAGDAHL